VLSFIVRFLPGLLIVASLPALAADPVAPKAQAARQTAAPKVDEATIRKTLAERMPTAPKIDAVRPSPMPGLWEVIIGNEVRYTDPTGSFLIEGELIDLKGKKNLTE